MLLVVVGYHLVLDGPHVLRCVSSNIRCYMQSISISLALEFVSLRLSLSLMNLCLMSTSYLSTIQISDPLSGLPVPLDLRVCTFTCVTCVLRVARAGATDGLRALSSWCTLHQFFLEPEVPSEGVSRLNRTPSFLHVFLPSRVPHVCSRMTGAAFERVWHVHLLINHARARVCDVCIRDDELSMGVWRHAQRLAGT